jgi:hypothetical protein
MQVAARLYEFHCFAKARRLLNVVGVRDAHVVSTSSLYDPSANCDGKKESDEDIEDLGPQFCGSTYRVFRNSDPTSSLVPRHTLVVGYEKKIAPFSVHPLVEKFLREQKEVEARNQDGVWFWQCRTECKMIPVDEEEEEDGQSRSVQLRCHPNYNQEGPWYDWVMARFEPYEGLVFQTPENIQKLRRNNLYNSIFGSGRNKIKEDQMKDLPMFDLDVLPCKILAFVEDPIDSSNVRAVVHGCCFRSTGSELFHDSVLLEYFNLSYTVEGSEEEGFSRVPHLSLLDLDNIVAPAFVIEEDPGIHESIPVEPKEANTSVILVRSHHKWGREFNDD